jgi:predicted deacylase
VKKDRQAPINVGGVEIGPGERRSVQIPVAKPYGQAQISLTAFVVHGRRPGPRLFVSAAVHGDEINGVEIIRRILQMGLLKRVHGTLIAVPVVNVYGFLNQARYLPDRRDLNRSFPGSPRGSLASRLAHVFMSEIALRCTHGIDLHTGSYHRGNLPQVRACIDDPQTHKLAHAFGVPVIINANLRDGSLRQAVFEQKIPMLLYEGGEALRFDELVIRAGVRGVLAVMRETGMLHDSKHAAPRVKPIVARSTTWVRAPDSGIFRTSTRLGAQVSEGARLGFISDPLGEKEVKIVAPAAGIVIGRTNLPLVNEGDALFHLGIFSRTETAAGRVEAFQAELDPAETESPSGEPPLT